MTDFLAGIETVTDIICEIGIRDYMRTVERFDTLGLADLDEIRETGEITDSPMRPEAVRFLADLEIHDRAEERLDAVNLKDIDYHVAPEDGGQLVIVAYAIVGDDPEDSLLIRRDDDGYRRDYAWRVCPPSYAREGGPWNGAPFHHTEGWENV